MNKKVLTFLLATACSLGMLNAHDFSQAGAKTEKNHYHEIQTEELYDLLYSGSDFILIDARTPKYDDGKRIPGAKFMPHNSPEQEIKKTIPVVDSTVVVYCTGVKCPASKLMADRLVGLGYINVWKYTDGLEGWIKAGHRVISSTKEP